MDAFQSPIWFIGDLGDAWVVAMADAVSAVGTLHRLDCPGPLPQHPFNPEHPPRVVVVHRHHLTASDAERVRGWREAGQANGTVSPLAVILCVSPYVRYEDLERWATIVDRVVPEAVAADVLPRSITRLLGERERQGLQLQLQPGLPAFRIEVAGGDIELGAAIVEACQMAGYRAEAVDDQEIGGILRTRNRSSTAAERVLTIWEVPVLEPNWAERLQAHVLRTGPMVALMGFADRATVARARASGAVACLELPCERDDLIDAVERAVRSTDLKSWPMPPRIEPPHVLPPRRHRQSQRRDSPATRF